jgi:hypothetical protein
MSSAISVSVHAPRFARRHEPRLRFDGRCASALDDGRRNDTVAVLRRKHPEERPRSRFRDPTGRQKPEPCSEDDRLRIFS